MLVSLPFRSSLVRALEDVALRPSADARAVKERIYAEQLDVSFRLAPVLVLSASSVVLVVAFCLWNVAPRGYFPALVAAMAVVAGFSLEMWLALAAAGAKPAASSGCDMSACLSSRSPLALGTCLASIPAILFAGADANYRLLIACTAAGVIAGRDERLRRSNGRNMLLWQRHYRRLVFGLASTGEAFYIIVRFIAGALFALHNFYDPAAFEHDPADANYFGDQGRTAKRRH